MKKEIFRKEALERMSSPEQLDELMPVTSPRGWIALVGFGSILLLIIIWGFLGRIDTSTKGSGALIREGGLHRYITPRDGEVIDVFVTVGDKVKKGDKLVKILYTEPGQNSEMRHFSCDHSGRVLYVSVVKGESARQGDLLVGIELPERPMQVVLYVSTKDGYQVQQGQTVRVMPANTSRYRSHALEGKVISAGQFPETRSTILRTIQNPDWVNQLVNKGPLLKVFVELPQNEESQELLFGTPCTAEITLSSKRPIEFIFPFFSN